MLEAAAVSQGSDNHSAAPLEGDAPKWEFPKIKGTLFGGPRNKDPTIQGTLFWVLFIRILLYRVPCFEVLIVRIL